MKKITAIALILALSYVSFAQESENREQRSQRESRQRMTPERREQMTNTSAQRQTEQLKVQLNLDEEQEKTIEAINLKYAVLRTQVSEAARVEQNANARELLNELDGKREAEILPILNENQIEVFFKNKTEQQERRQQMRERVEESRQQRRRQIEQP
ncbi:MAG: hypothetical protein FWG79_07410 [Bacteroidales bacterium]|nr:hypothetical protein [Bacteroidales bacterium]